MLHTVFGPIAAILPTLRPCDNAEDQRRRNGLVVVGTVLLFVVLAVRGEDLVTVLAIAAALIATSIALVQAVLLVPVSPAPPDGRGPIS